MGRVYIQLVVVHRPPARASSPRPLLSALVMRIRMREAAAVWWKTVRRVRYSLLAVAAICFGWILDHGSSPQKGL
ncbi:MAG: hypothetical protein WCC06_12725 [Candidatus Aminicenantales bacterium]